MPQIGTTDTAAVLVIADTLPRRRIASASGLTNRAVSAIRSVAVRYSLRIAFPHLRPCRAGFAMSTHFSRWRFWKRWFGQRSERAAAKFLRKLGWRIVGTNLNEHLGEIDLLAVDGDTLVVVEVRSTSGSDPHVPAASVNYAKQKKLTQAMLRFFGRHRLLGVNTRFDILALAWPDGQQEPTVLHIKHAFEATGRFQMWS